VGWSTWCYCEQQAPTAVLDRFLLTDSLPDRNGGAGKRIINRTMDRLLQRQWWVDL